MDDLALIATVMRSQRRVATALLIVVFVLYTGFMALVGYGRAALAQQIAEGLSVALVLGALLIVAACVLAWIYVTWAGRHLDPAAADARRDA